MKYFKNTSWLMAENVLRMFVGLVVSVWVARYLGPEELGVFRYAQSFVSLFIIISTLGLDSIIVRDLVNNEAQRDQLLGTAFCLKIIGALCLILTLIVFLFFSGHTSQVNVFILIIACGTIFQSINVINFYFQSKVLSKYTVYCNTVTLFISSLIKIILIYYNAPLILFVVVTLVDTLISLSGLIYFYHSLKLSIKKWKFSKLIALSILKESMPLAIAGSINSVQMNIDQIMINNVLGSVYVGHYSVAVKLTMVWFGIGVMVCNSLFPAIINAKKNNDELYLIRIYRLFRLLVTIAYLLSIFVYFFSDFFIFKLYGDAFKESAEVLTIYIFSVVFVYLGVSSGRWFICEGKVKLNLYRNTVAVFINIVLNLLLIKDLGIVGAAYASLISYIVGFYFFDLCLRETRYIFILKSKALLLFFPFRYIDRAHDKK